MHVWCYSNAVTIMTEYPPSYTDKDRKQPTNPKPSSLDSTKLISFASDTDFAKYNIISSKRRIKKQKKVTPTCAIYLICNLRQQTA
jgi:hypothetical protein